VIAKRFLVIFVKRERLEMRILSTDKNFCLKCHTTFEGEAAFCPNCGAALTKSELPSGASVARVANKQSTTAPSPQRYAQSQPPAPPVTVIVQQPPPAAKREDPLALVSLIMGILGITFLPIVASIVAIITGHISLKREKNGMAIAGVVLGYIPVILAFLYTLAYVIFFLALFYSL